MPQNSDHFKDISWALLERYVANDLSPTEALDVEAILAARPAARQLIDAYRRMASTVVPRPDMTDVDAALERLSDRLDKRVALQAPAMSPAVSSKSSLWNVRPVVGSVSGELLSLRRGGKMGARAPWRWAIAGIACVAVLAVLMLHSPAARTTQVPVRTYATTREQRATVTLRDGTTVTLAPQTTLVVPAGFGTTERTVSLTGEAYFEVAKMTENPFIVRTGDVATRVLGTAFDITRYRGDRAARVAVVSGKVAVVPALFGGAHTAHSMVVVTAGMIAQVTDSAVIATMVGDLSAYTAWTQGTLAFHNTPVLEVLTVVGHWYGYQFHVADSTLATRALTAVFEGESSADVLRSLETLLQVTMDFNGQVVTLRARPSNSRISRPTRRALLDSLVTLNREVGR